jgi:hypothetical protein
VKTAAKLLRFGSLNWHFYSLFEPKKTILTGTQHFWGKFDKNGKFAS